MGSCISGKPWVRTVKDVYVHNRRPFQYCLLKVWGKYVYSIQRGLVRVPLPSLNKGLFSIVPCIYWFLFVKDSNCVYVCLFELPGHLLNLFVWVFSPSHRNEIIVWQIRELWVSVILIWRIEIVGQKLANIPLWIKKHWDLQSFGSSSLCIGTPPL